MLRNLASRNMTHFCLMNCLHSSQHRFHNMLETFIRDFGPHHHNSITHLLQIVGWIFMMEIFHSTPIQRSPIKLRCWDYGAVGLQNTKYFCVQEIGFSLFELCSDLLGVASRLKGMCMIRWAVALKCSDASKWVYMNVVAKINTNLTRPDHYNLLLCSLTLRKHFYSSNYH